MGKATVNYLKDIKVGDTVWVYFSDKNRYDKDGRYVGRGVFALCNVTGIARKYFTASQSNGLASDYERITGASRCKNGFAPSERAMGEIEKWLKINRHTIVHKVEHSDAETLLKIAEMIGVEVPSL